MRHFLIFFTLLIAFAAGASAQTPVSVTFDDKSDLAVVDYLRTDRKITVEKIVEKDFTAQFDSIRKANSVFSANILRALKRKNPSLARQIEKINSAYQLKQAENELDFASLSTVNYDKLRICANAETPCRLKGRAIIITISEQGTKHNVLLIKSLQKIK